MYNQLTPEIIEEIKKVSNNVFLGEEINPDYAKDEMPIYGTHMPDLAVQPRSTEEVAAVMKICYENNIPVTPRGAGTGLAGGAVPLYGGVLIDISKMNKIKSYDMENFVVEIEAGVLLNDLAEDCQSKGMLYPPDPGEKFACVGGNVATNAGGMRAVKYGVTRDYVRGLEVVKADEAADDARLGDLAESELEDDADREDDENRHQQDARQQPDIWFPFVTHENGIQFSYLPMSDNAFPPPRKKEAVGKADERRLILILVKMA